MLYDFKELKIQLGHILNSIMEKEIKHNILLKVLPSLIVTAFQKIIKSEALGPSRRKSEKPNV